MSKFNIVVLGLLGLISVCVGQGVTQPNQQCDLTVEVVNDFDAIAYLGVWYDLESLPSAFQSGPCNTATYTLNTDGSINVQNSHNLNGVMTFANGVARPQAGAGTSAKFDVTISPSTTPVPYWILDTDYETFALVYSCRNEGTGRVVNSWKLARNRGALPAAATARINAAINRVDALSAAASQYVQRDHSGASCMVEYTGACPTVTGVANFNVNNYLGPWYEAARYPQTAQTGQCNRANYAQGTEAVTVQNTQVFNEALGTISGTATTVPGQSGVLAVTLNTGSGPQAQNLVVLATDYNNYALVYSCAVQDNGRHRVGSWLLRRSLEPLSTEANVAINNAISATTGLQPGFYYPTNQDDAACFYYPEVDQLPGGIVELPGPCDSSITGVADFNINRFFGVWLEEQRYPQTTQGGECNRATYAQGTTDGVFTVTNTQVTSASLSTISGQATPVPNEPGVLAVTFSPGGVFTTRRLYVLGTDYESYALLYSCNNIAGNRRQVGSWKLRRNLDVPLSTEATNNINALVTRTQGLRQEYYRTTSHTNAACFYYPPVDQLPGGLVELTGPCDTSITGLANFNVNNFLGVWIEARRYPQTAQTGQCNRATWGQGTTNGVYTVQNRQVTDESLLTISGEASAVANQPGVLAVTFNIGGVPTTESIYVLATDYDTYALLYTCTNIAENRRRVGSWELRRNIDVPLSTEATNNINSVIERTEGLRQEYYRTTYQTDAACFHYPPADQLLPGLITLPGPCNTSVTGVPNFDASRYLGTWLEMARYPQTAQTGQCNRANYAQGNGFFTVQNTQVVNQELSTITGEARATEQSGVLQVTFNINNQPTNQLLYVLATDYDNYALVYTCNNIEGNQRQVGSWKLRRSLVELSEAANNAINSVITQTQGLREEYYQSTEQTSAACFYYPAQTGNEERVIIPGQCDTGFTGLANINVTRFADDAVWYQIRRYDAVGNRSCIATRFDMEGDTYIDVNFVEVVGEEVTRVEAVARLDSAATGRFVVTFADSERSNEVFYILATDYDNFAIAYNCANEGTNQRHVGVWLLSRTRVWPTAGNAILNNLIATRQEITDRSGYFKNVPHNDDCPEPSSAFLFRSSIIVIFVCTVLQLVW